jgi:DNA polymerase
MNGIPMDQNLLRKNLEEIKTRLFEAEQSIPWIGEKTALSRTAINEECRKNGVLPPASWAQESEEADAWFEKHGAKFLWAKAVRDFRRINAFLKKLEAFDRATLADGRYYGGCMYFGAHTGRFSGSGGNLNLQNLPKEEMFGVNFRHMFKASPGNTLVVADLSQIEVRTLCWLAKDTKALDLIRASDDIYEAFGVLLGLHDPANGSLRNNPSLRQKVKTLTLGCGFMMGPERFAANNNISVEEATASVDLYRSRMKAVVNYWGSHKKSMATAHALGVPLQTELPSGRVLDYGVLKRMKDKKNGYFRYIAKMSRFGKMRDVAIHPGTLTENAAQALARDIFSDMMVRVNDAGIKIIMHVHDELVCEVPEEHGEESLKRILEIMHSPPEWIPDIPVAAEGTLTPFYTK